MLRIATARDSDTYGQMSDMSLSKAIKCVYYTEPLRRMSQSIIQVAEHRA